MSKEFLGYVITDIDYKDNHIYKCYGIHDNYTREFIRNEYEAVNEHINVPNGIYNKSHDLYNENELRLKAAKLENAPKLGQGKGVCSHCIMTLYSNND